jgi:uncharacterized protein YqeY
MSLQTKIKEEVKEAMKSRDALRLSVIRGLVSGFTNELVSKGRKPDGELSDEEVMAVIRRQVNQRKDSIEQFENGGRGDLAENEKKELAVLETYLPAQMPREKLAEIVKAKIAELGVTDKSGSGKLIGAVMKDLKGQADGVSVKSVVDEILG